MERIYPFIYFGHGTSYARKALGCYILFKKEIPSKFHKDIEKTIPIPLNSFLNGENNQFVLEVMNHMILRLKKYTRERVLHGMFLKKN